jgi:hypothetical protein
MKLEKNARLGAKNPGFWFSFAKASNKTNIFEMTNTCMGMLVERKFIFKIFGHFIIFGTLYKN